MQILSWDLFKAHVLLGQRVHKGGTVADSKFLPLCYNSEGAFTLTAVKSGNILLKNSLV